MQHDRELTAEVVAELRDEPTICDERIGIHTSNGIVTLSGFVATCAKKEAADRAVRRVPGVKGLLSEIAIRHGAAGRVPRDELGVAIAE